MHVSPIETVWRGYRFRSRLEARWAVFFDTLGLRWEYEPEGLEAPGVGRWLPDFRVEYPGRHCGEAHSVLFEVKPDLATVDQSYFAKIAELSTGEKPGASAAGLHDGVIVLDGPVSLGPFYPAAMLAVDRDAARTPPERRWAYFLWCPKGRLWWDDRSCFMHTPDECYGDPELTRAIEAARGARFEFGESPA